MKVYLPQLIGIFISFLLLVFIIWLVKRRKLSEEYSLFWVIVGILLLILSVLKKILINLTQILGFPAPITSLLFFGVVFLICLSLFFSIKISQLQKNLLTLTQKFALLSKELEDVRGQ
jgi:hypothetical protein